MAAVAADAAGMNGASLRRLARLAEERAARRREEVARAAADAGVEETAIEGETVRLSGPALMRRWMNGLGLREAGRGRG